MYTIIKKLMGFAALAGIALIICGFASSYITKEFAENSETTTAYVTTIEEGGLFTNGYKVNLRYEIDGQRYDATLASGALGEAFVLLESKAEAAQMDVIDYVDTVGIADKQIEILYNKDIPKSVKYVEYTDYSEDFYLWGGITLGAAVIIAIMNKSAKNKREERAAEKRVEQKQARQQNQQ